MKKILFIVVPLFVMVLVVSLVKKLPVHAAGEPLTISAPATWSSTNTVTAPKFIDSSGAGVYFIDPSAAASVVVAGTVTAPTFSGALSGNATSANSVVGTNLGKTGAQGFFTTTGWTTTDWSNLAIGSGGMAIANTPGAASTNYGYFIKTGNRDGGGGWGGIWMDYNGGNMYFGNTSVGSSFAAWQMLISSSNIASQTVSNSDMTDGYHANAGVAGNNIPVRTANGYINSNYFNMTADVVTSNPQYVAAEWSGDNYLRWVAPGYLSVNYANTAGTATNLSGGSVNATGNIVINNGSPTIYFQDTDERSVMLHNNSNLFYILRGSGTNSLSWATYNGVWPFYINLENNNAYFGGSVSATSDVRLKTNIKSLPQNTLEKVMQLRGVYFNWKTDADMGKSTQIGVIAQEVEKIFPELVTNGADGYKSVAYDRLGPILIEAVKEQQKEIDSLKSDVSSLKKEMEIIKQTLKTNEK